MRLARLRDAIVSLDHFARIHFFGYTCLWPLLGAAAVDAPPRAVVALLLIAVPFHLFGGVLNDVVDLEIDRTEPKRAEAALVRGRISRGQALAFALFQLPILFLLTGWFAGTPRAFGLMAGAVASMAAYDLFSKRCPLPPLTDALQGASWASLIYLSAELAGREPGALTAIAAGYALVYTLLMNGVHGCMRDLENDLAHGARTTAIWLGIRPDGERVMRIPRRAGVYAMALTLGLVGLGAFALLRNDAGLEPALRGLLAGLLVVAATLCVWGMRRSLQPASPGWELVFRAHLFILLAPGLLAVLPASEPWLGATLLGVLLVPLVLIDHVRILLALPFSRRAAASASVMRTARSGGP